MSEPKHTPGPWNMLHDSSFDECVIFAERADEQVDICEVSTYITMSNDDNRIDVDQIIANANLIAAAPDLYKALDKACQRNCHCRNYDDTCKGCYMGKALRKARGEGE